MTRKEAKDRNLTRYFTGKPCKNGHASERNVQNGVCSTCAKDNTKKWRRDGKKQEMMPPKELPELSYLLECFEIIGDVLHWKTRPFSHFTSSRNFNVFNSRYAGKAAGHMNKTNKYLEVRLDGKIYKGHRILYKMNTGVEPQLIVDHIDGDVTNNSISNLRECNSQENARNASKRTKIGTSIYKGVQYNQGKWYACITVDDNVTLIEEDSELAAAQRYDAEAERLFGDFAKLNFEVGI